MLLYIKEKGFLSIKEMEERGTLRKDFFFDERIIPKRGFVYGLIKCQIHKNLYKIILIKLL